MDAATKEGWTAHIPQCIPYPLAGVLGDLLHFSAIHLVVGGRLVYWMPVHLSTFEVIAKSRQYHEVIF